MPKHNYELVFVKKHLEAWAGIEPAYKGFADPRLTTWLPGQYNADQYSSN